MAAVVTERFRFAVAGRRRYRPVALALGSGSTGCVVLPALAPFRMARRATGDVRGIRDVVLEPSRGPAAERRQSVPGGLPASLETTDKSEILVFAGQGIVACR